MAAIHRSRRGTVLFEDRPALRITGEVVDLVRVDLGVVQLFDRLRRREEGVLDGIELALGVQLAPLLQGGHLFGIHDRLGVGQLRVKVPHVVKSLSANPANPVERLVHPVARGEDITRRRACVGPRITRPWNSGGTSTPASARVVAGRSRKQTRSSRTLPGSTWPGQRTISGTCVPEL